MLTKDSLIKYILEKSVDFKRYLEISEPHWKDEGDYIILAEFSRYILDLCKNKREEELKGSFNIIDVVFREGDDYVKEAIRIGLLENLQNNISWEESKPDLLPYLSEDLKVEWDSVIKFWDNK